MIIINTNKCIGCGICTAVCPREALEALRGYSEVDYQKCTDCFGGVFLFTETEAVKDTSSWKKKDYQWDQLCVQYCPVQAIETVEAKPAQRSRARG